MKESGLSQAAMALMQGVSEKNTEIEKVILFGSQAKGNYKESSDIALAIVSGKGLLFCEDVKSQLSELPALYKFDIIDYEHIKNAEIRKHIERIGVMVYERCNV